MTEVTRAVHIADWLALSSAAVTGLALVAVVLLVRRSTLHQHDRRLLANVATVIAFAFVIAAVMSTYLAVDTLLVTSAVHRHIPDAALKYLGAASAIARQHAHATLQETAIVEPLPRAYPFWLPFVAAVAILPIGTIAFSVLARLGFGVGRSHVRRSP